MCHVPEQAFTQNELATPVGIEGAFVRRNAPALYNVAYRPLLFHDGRETALAEQIWSPLLADNEMGNASRAEVLERVAAVPEYARAFEETFEDGLNPENLGHALAAYQRALLSANSPFDRWFFGGDPAAVSPAAKRGFNTFNEAGCARCHTYSHASALFADGAFHRTGVAYASRERARRGPERVQLAPGVSIVPTTRIPLPAQPDDGRREVSGDEGDQWRYRTPTLRNVALTAPYMHDGSLRTLAEVVAFYDAGSTDPGRDPALEPLGLSAAERADLIAFLTALTGDNVAALAADARSVGIGDRMHTP
jgi:cytochrome c peroxidase